MYRTKSNETKYKVVRKVPNRCPFCKPSKEEILLETDSFYLLENIYGYDVWDRRKVNKHLLIIPKEHKVSLNEINQNQDGEYLKLLKKYSNLGYDIFTRSNSSTTKTQPHFHTHLIKTDKKSFDFIQFRSEPYELIFK